MITWFRKLAQSWVAKVLFVLLILSFGIWGIEDVVRNIWRDSAVVRMEGATIDLPEAQNAARRELNRVQSQLGRDFQPDATLRRAIANQAIEGLVAEHAQRREAVRMGVATPETEIRDYVLAIPSFQVGGRFSRPILDQFLRQNDITEPQFLQLVRDDLQRIQLLGAVRAGAAAPETLARALVSYERERRVAQLAEFPLLEAPEPEPPTDAALERFHANNPAQFSTPEMREAAIAVLSADALADQVDLAEDEVRAAFEARRAQFETPERRDLQQVLVPTEAAAKALATAWATAPDFAAIETEAREAGGGALALGALAKADLPIEALAEAAFALPSGGITAPIQSPFGWHVLRAASITPGSTARFEEVEAELRRTVALERAADLAFERTSRMEDAFAAGTNLETAGRENGALLAVVRIDRQGRDADGLPTPLPVPEPARAEVLRAIATAEMGRAPRLAELTQADAFVAVELRAISPPALRPLAEVIDDVRLAFLTEARRRAQEERAAALLGAVRGGATLEAAAQAANVRSERVGPFARQPDEQAAPGTGVPPELLPVLFATPVGQATMVPTRSGFAVAQLLEIVPVDPAADAEALANARRAAQAQAAADLEAQFGAALRSRAAPRLNQSLLPQVVP
jgi:peptidyl-prolyl cis-trans isomerase D